MTKSADSKSNPSSIQDRRNIWLTTQDSVLYVVLFRKLATPAEWVPPEADQLSNFNIIWLKTEDHAMNLLLFREETILWNLM